MYPSNYRKQEAAHHRQPSTPLKCIRSDSFETVTALPSVPSTINGEMKEYETPLPIPCEQFSRFTKHNARSCEKMQLSDRTEMGFFLDRENEETDGIPRIGVLDLVNVLFLEAKNMEIKPWKEEESIECRAIHFGLMIIKGWCGCITT